MLQPSDWCQHRCFEKFGCIVLTKASMERDWRMIYTCLRAAAYKRKSDVPHFLSAHPARLSFKSR